MFSRKNLSVKKNKIRMGLGILLLSLLLAANAGKYVLGMEWFDAKNLTADNTLSAEGKATEFYVLKANRDIPVGMQANSSDFQLFQVGEDLALTDGVSDINDLKNMRLVKTIKRNQLLMHSDLVQENYFFKSDDRLIEQSFAPEGIPKDCREGSLIDIRLFREWENDPVVISKAFVLKREESSLTMYMDALEQELLKQAIREGPLYILIYGDPGQEASIVDYMPRYGGGENER